MKITNIEIEKIKPYVNNTKKHPETQIKNIAESIKQFGFIQPLVLDKSKDNEIIIGHGRYFASQLIGLDKVPCVFVENLTDEQIRKLRILDNKLNESEWDDDLLKLELNDLDFGDFEVEFDIEIITPDDFGEDFELPSGDKAPYKQITFTLSNEQAEFIDDCVSKAKQDKIIDNYDNYGNQNNNGNALYAIIREWEKQKI